jgi:hypothetical protein
MPDILAADINLTIPTGVIPMALGACAVAAVLLWLVMRKR